ncbi:hypothetical protein ACHAPE_000562 [Trichoderma viride]
MIFPPEESAQFGTGEPSQELKSAFALMIKTVETIKAQVLKSSGIIASGTDAATIMTWQEDIKKAKAIALKLETKAKTFPSSSASTGQVRSLKTDVPNTDYSAQNAALDTATEKLAIDQRALNAAQENYQKTSHTQGATEAHGHPNQAQGSRGGGPDSRKVKDILIYCIATLVQLKVQIGKLKSFSGPLSTMACLIVQNKVKNFDEDVSSIVVDTGLSLTQNKGCFELLQIIARMYCQMHVNHVSKGMDLVWDLSQMLKEPSEVAVKRDALNNWATSVPQAILETVADKQNEIKYNLEERIENISAQNKMLEKAA